MLNHITIILPRQAFSPYALTSTCCLRLAFSRNRNNLPQIADSCQVEFSEHPWKFSSGKIRQSGKKSGIRNGNRNPALTNPPDKVYCCCNIILLFHILYFLVYYFLYHFQNRLSLKKSWNLNFD